MKASDMFYELTIDSSRKLAYMLAKGNNIKVPKTWEVASKAGYDWLYGFMGRNPELSIRQPGETSIAHAAAFNKMTIEK